LPDPARKQSSTTPRCAASTTKPCAETSVCSPSIGSPLPRPPCTHRDAKTARDAKRTHTSKTEKSNFPTDAPRSSSSTPKAAPSASANSPTEPTSGSSRSGACEPTGTPDKNGKFRWYNDYALPEYYGGTTITVRLHNTADDARRKLNRTENLRPIAPGDPDFARLYSRRNDAESIDRDLEDTLWLRRAHSVGHARQLLNLIGYAITVNALDTHRYRRRQPSLAA